jgi:hypothetical protein
VDKKDATDIDGCEISLDPYYPLNPCSNTDLSFNIFSYEMAPGKRFEARPEI